MPTPRRALLLFNTVSGVGHAAALRAEIEARLRAGLAPAPPLDVATVSDHPAASAAAAAFLSASDAPGVIVVGGGGGTLRAVIEGVCAGCAPGALPGVERIRIGALRMGSGNVLAKQFGVPKDPLAGIAALARSLQAERSVPCCIMRCEAGQRGGGRSVYHAATLGGFGQFGCVPGDLERFHRRFPRLRKTLAALVGIERMTSVEYGLALLLRSCACALRPSRCAEISVTLNGQPPQTLRLLAGALLNFKLPMLPFEPGVNVSDAALSLQLLPFPGRLRALQLVLAPKALARRALAWRIGPSDTVRLRLNTGQSAEYFLDENPHEFFEWAALSIAGTLAFVPGSLDNGEPQR